MILIVISFFKDIRKSTAIGKCLFQDKNNEVVTTNNSDVYVEKKNNGADSNSSESLGV